MNNTVQPSLISYAGWNIWQSPNQSSLQNGVNNKYCSLYGYHELAVQPIPQPLLELQQQQKPKTIVQPTKSQQANQLCIDSQICLTPSQDWKLRSAALPQQPSSLMLSDPTHATFSSTMADIVLQFLIQNPGDPWLTVPFQTDHSSDTTPNHHQQPVNNYRPIKTQAPGYHWTTAIIQKLWNMAWDILAHQKIRLP